ncbi:hypothetical protein FOZ60_013817 [Perkinsus olseni]|uniref:non-specific serine/threonine protein kinase n=1 Tax=Perkinsus olseni TaxID=32597 RepID=A0A7J6P847_PEROL|nr:hypothetical protein FOZ60_013817 [Perkinsus olseni]
MGNICGSKSGPSTTVNGTTSKVPQKEVAEGGFARANFIVDNTGTLTQFYDLEGKKLGQGSYGSVCKATNKSTAAVRAVKTISKSHVKNVDRFKQEIAIMKMLDHPNIIKLFETFEDHPEQALNHLWVRNKAPKAQGAPLEGAQIENLKSFRSQNKLKKAALHVIAQQLPDEEIDQLKKIFISIDKNGDGQLTVHEIVEGINQAGLKEIPDNLMEIMKQVDADGSGVIDYTEFIAATLDRKSVQQGERRSMFVNAKSLLALP